MTGTDDDDLKSLRASSWALKELQSRLPQFLETLDSMKAEAGPDELPGKDLAGVLDLVSKILRNKYKS